MKKRFTHRNPSFLHSETSSISLPMHFGLGPLRLLAQVDTPLLPVHCVELMIAHGSDDSSISSIDSIGGYRLGGSSGQVTANR